MSASSNAELLLLRPRRDFSSDTRRLLTSLVSTELIRFQRLLQSATLQWVLFGSTNQNNAGGARPEAVFPQRVLHAISVPSSLGIGGERESRRGVAHGQRRGGNDDYDS